ncbi:aspartic peptidase domain-containing protein, partial [Lactarius deliciosus]
MYRLLNLQQSAGNVNLASMGFDNYTVDKQAFILVNDTSTFSSSLQSNGFQGLMGLGFDDGSIVRGIVGDGAGDTPLSRIFQQNKTTQNFISILLDRNNDPTDTVTGQITISESIESQPKLYIKDVFFDSSSQHWAVYIDKERLSPVLDSGFTFSQVPRKMADAIYGRVQGANYSQEEGLWMVPCDQELNITFTFAGVKMPVHPLDVVSGDFNLGSYCPRNSYQPITTAFSVLGDYDMILGMSFMRNVYALFDYGNY